MDDKFYYLVGEDGNCLIACEICMRTLAEFGGDWTIIDSLAVDTFDAKIERCSHLVES